MAGSGVTKRHHAESIRAAKLKANGWTTRNIAEALGIAPDKVKARVILGERLMQAKEE